MNSYVMQSLVVQVTDEIKKINYILKRCGVFFKTINTQKYI